MTARIRACIVCGCTEDRACAGGCWWLAHPHSDVCSACAAATKHMPVYMARDQRTPGYRSKRTTITSVATCPCGWTSTTAARHHRKQDAAVRAHWQAVVKHSPMAARA